MIGPPPRSPSDQPWTWLHQGLKWWSATSRAKSSRALVALSPSPVQRCTRPLGLGDDADDEGPRGPPFKGVICNIDSKKCDSELYYNIYISISLSLSLPLSTQCLTTCLQDLERGSEPGCEGNSPTTRGISLLKITSLLMVLAAWSAKWWAWRWRTVFPLPECKMNHSINVPCNKIAPTVGQHGNMLNLDPFDLSINSFQTHSFKGAKWGRMNELSLAHANSNSSCK